LTTTINQIEIFLKDRNPGIAYEIERSTNSPLEVLFKQEEQNIDEKSPDSRFKRNSPQH
jgi:hypothetical protein